MNRRGFSRNVDNMRTHGAWVDLQIGWVPWEARLLEKYNVTVPQPIAARALIDTGASISAISETVRLALGLVPHNIKRNLYGATHKDPVERETYRIEVIFPDESSSSPIRLRTLAVAATLAAPPEIKPLDCLIGRDVLQYAEFIYSGHDDSYRFELRQRVKG